jgi:hypothetical protein
MFPAESGSNPRGEEVERMRWGTRIALIVAIGLLVMSFAGLGGSFAQAAVKERVKLSIPDPGQLAAARLEFKVEGEKKPKLKIKAKNAKVLAPEVVAAAQMTRSTEKKGRAVALVAIGNMPPPAPPAAGRDARITAESVVVDVAAAGTGQRISDIQFSDLPGNSRNFLSLLGVEPQAERAEAQEVFDLPETQLPFDPVGRLDLTGATEIMDLKPVRESQVITRETIEALDPERMISSAIAAAIGPPAALDADVYGFFSGRKVPLRVQATVGLSPSNPSVVFSGVQYDTPVMGAQVSQLSDNMVLHTADARCQNGFLQDGVVTWGQGPLLPGVSASYRLDCDVPQDSQVVFFDVSMQRAPDPGIDIFNLLPLPFYGDDQVGEAVASEASSYLVRF